MNLLSRVLLGTLAISFPLMAGTVVVTSLPDDEHPLDPVTSLNGIPLTDGVAIRVGAFPGMTDDALLNAAAMGGFAGVSGSLVPFGETCAIGEGAAGTAGSFEVALKQDTAGSPLVGEEVSLLIQKDGGQEFLIARFKGRVFQADSETGLEPVLSLHLADAKVIVGNRYGSSQFATSSAPAGGSYSSWISGFPDITDPLERLPDADADGDGRTNFFEYATAGDPGSGADPAPCQIVVDGSGDRWIRFSRAAGIGVVRHVIESSGDLLSPWQALEGSVEADPDPPLAGSLNWIRIRVPQPSGSKGFFRLRSEPTDTP